MQAQDFNDSAEIAAVAARLVVDDGLDYAAAKRQAIKQLGLPARTPLPDNASLDAAVREHIQIFCADTQPGEQAALRELALVWMQRLGVFRPHVGGALWHGTATRHSDITLQLFCDDPKAAELALIDHRVDYQAGSVTGWKGGTVDALSLRVRSEPLDQWVLVHLVVYDFDDLRGALRPDAQGRRPRGDAEALRERMAAEPQENPQ
jgi:hypothetical protein